MHTYIHTHIHILLNMGPAKDKHGVRESFAKIFFIREEWPFRDKGILINNPIYIYTTRAFRTFFIFLFFLFCVCMRVCHCLQSVAQDSPN